MDIELASLTKRYEDTVAVHGIDLKIRSGTYCCLLCPSSCGKTSALRMIAGLARCLAPSLPVPVLCALRATLAVANLGPAKARKGSLAAPPSVPSCGLSPALEEVLSPSLATEAALQSDPEAPSDTLANDTGACAVPC
jgi:energy-coupling factor transporter ATP-binding protein EcfA2